MITSNKVNINNPGTLFVVATPIGNLKDISIRALEVLQEVDCIAAEDTRHSAALLQHFAISTPILSLHNHNERTRSESLLKRLQEGESIALISDAGTPLISDPGYFLVKEARQLGVKVVPVPGACAAISALSVAGLPSDQFFFVGFLPSKSQPRISQLTLLKHQTSTLIFYEAPHRILACLKDMMKIFGEEREVVIARELTKKFETVIVGQFEALIHTLQKDLNQQKGEFVILVEGSKEVKTSALTLSTDETLKLLLDDLPLKKAVELTAKLTGARKNELYDTALKLSNPKK